MIQVIYLLCQILDQGYHVPFEVLAASPSKEKIEKLKKKLEAEGKTWLMILEAPTAESQL